MAYASPGSSPHWRRHVDMLKSVQRWEATLAGDGRELTYKERIVTIDLPTLEDRRMLGEPLLYLSRI